MLLLIFLLISTLVEINSTGSKNYFLSDHLGSTSVLVNSTGKLIEKTRYDPFGSELAGGNKSKYGYNGKEEDVTTGLLYYGARYYNPRLKRWTQADPVIQDAYDPQTLNHYSYVKNNPMKYTDPTGNNPLLAIIKIGSAIVDYGWNVYDFIGDSLTLSNPESSETDKAVASLGLSLNLVLEAEEPDEVSPVNLPADDIMRNAAKKGLRETLEKGLKNSADEVADALKSGKTLVTKAQATIKNKDLSHILKHRYPNSKKTLHGVFDVKSDAEVVNIIDEGINIARSGKATAEGKSGEIIVDMGRYIGKGSEGTKEAEVQFQYLKIIVDKNDPNRVLNAFPVSADEVAKYLPK